MTQHAARALASPPKRPGPSPVTCYSLTIPGPFGEIALPNSRHILQVPKRLGELRRVELLELNPRRIDAARVGILEAALAVPFSGPRTLSRTKLRCSQFPRNSPLDLVLTTRARPSELSDLSSRCCRRSAGSRLAAERSSARTLQPCNRGGAEERRSAFKGRAKQAGTMVLAQSWRGRGPSGPV